MYKFRKLKTEYAVKYIMVSPDFQESVYSARIVVLTSYNNQQEDFTFELTSRYDIKLNDVAPTQEVDLFMMRLSESLYPIKLCVSKSGSIQRVINFDGIKTRWEGKCKEILDESYSVVLDKYISLSKDNMKDEKSFLASLRRDSFVQLYFSEIDSDYFDFTCYNFPGQQGSACFNNMQSVSDKTFNNEKIYLYEDEYQRGKVRYEYSELMDLLSIYAEFDSSENGENYTKKFSITSDINTREVRKANKLISFLAD